MNQRKEQFLKSAKADKLRLKNYGFIHIPKTGGTSISKFGAKVMSAGGKFPVTFPHGWTAELIFQEFPKIQLCFIIRDPIERTISGINSRLRMGRPQYNSMWDVAEAVSFGFFSSAEEVLNGLASTDERIKSAAMFAFEHIRHIKHGYQFYFKSADFVREHAGRFAVVKEIGETDAFVSQLCSLTQIAPALRETHYRPLHVAPQPTRNLVAALTPATLAAVRAHLAREYEIYEALGQLTGRIIP